MKHIVRRSCVIVGLGVLVGFLSVKSRPAGIEATAQLERTVHGLEQIDAEIDAEVLKLRSGLRSNYDRLTFYQRQLGSSAAAAGRLVRPAVQASVAGRQRKALAEAVQQKLLMLETFKSQHAQLALSRAMFRNFEKRLSELTADQGQGRSLPWPLCELKEASIEFASGADATRPERLEAAIARVAQAEIEPDSAAAKARAGLLAQSRKMLTLQLALARWQRDVDLIPVDESLARIVGTADADSAQARGAAARYGRAWLVTSLLLLGYSGYVLYRAGRYIVETRAVKLQLEQRVDAQTRALEAANRESAQLLQALSAAVVRLDGEGRVLCWNRAAERLFGVAMDAALDAPFDQLPIAWKNPKWLARLKQSGASADSMQLETQLQTAADRQQIISLTLHPLGEPLSQAGWLLLASDVSAQRSLEKQLQHAHKLESVGQLAAGVAHEINTPMQYIGDNVQFLKNSLAHLQPALALLCQSSEQQAMDADIEQQLLETLEGLNLKRMLDHLPKAIEDAEQGVGQVARIVHAMREVSDSGPEQPMLLDLNRIIESTVVVSRSEWKFVAEMECDLAHDLPMIPGFAAELHQVFLNLIVNAAHAITAPSAQRGTEKQVIRINSRHDNQWCTVTVEDSGCGIPEELHSRIFDPSYASTEDDATGGKGLVVAHQVVVQKHGGKIWFDTAVGIGTTFTVQLPLSSVAALSS
ncbi:MAG: ATP-binding protein [Aureliella sp.]